MVVLLRFKEMTWDMAKQDIAEVTEPMAVINLKGVASSSIYPRKQTQFSLPRCPYGQYGNLGLLLPQEEALPDIQQPAPLRQHGLPSTVRSTTRSRNSCAIPIFHSQLSSKTTPAARDSKESRGAETYLGFEAPAAHRTFLGRSSHQPERLETAQHLRSPETSRLLGSSCDRCRGNANPRGAQPTGRPTHGARH
ncbi:hypothetical protein MANES_06G119132v8 [Manihot esculenta]|uniref:Uncharacterized protein n=1 Tax=Manihot esculenta TaxID=3983 RepID=A0ACB7HL22_MANES|nr:hypothetical protein MANES_06G119132v8 [Manihot esculenta]